MLTEKDTGDELRKQCPRCGAAHALAAAACEQCGRRFRTTFPPTDATLQMPAALLPAGRPEPLPIAQNLPPPPALLPTVPLPPALVPSPPASNEPLRLGRPKSLVVPTVIPPEVRHRAALDEFSRRFLGLAPFYALAVLTAPTVLVPLFVVPALRAAEAGTCAEVSSLGVDAQAWAAPLRRARVAKIVRSVATALLLAALFVGVVVVLHKAINVLDNRLDPVIPDSGGTGSSSSN